MKIEEYNKPNTIKEAIEILNDIFYNSRKEEQDYFTQSTSPSIMIEYHMSLGMVIRNAWLWPDKDRKYSKISKIFINLNIKHCDDMSHFLFELFWYYKHQPDISLEKHEERMRNERMIKDIIE